MIALALSVYLFLAPPVVIPCDTDLDCEIKNPRIEPY